MYTMTNQAKEEQEELAMDMKILEQMLAESTNEAMQGLQKKVHTVHALICALTSLVIPVPRTSFVRR